MAQRRLGSDAGRVELARALGSILQEGLAPRRRRAGAGVGVAADRPAGVGPGVRAQSFAAGGEAGGCSDHGSWRHADDPGRNALPEEPEPGQTWLLRERRAGAYQRSFALAVPVDSDRAVAKFDNGVLTLTAAEGA